MQGWQCRIGPESTVVLKSTFLDERVRVGKGSRGSLFVFTRGGAADAAGNSGPLRVAWHMPVASITFSEAFFRVCQPYIPAAPTPHLLLGTCMLPTPRTGMDQVGLQQCSTLGKVLLFGIVAALMLNGGWLTVNSTLPPVIRAAGVVQVRLQLAGCWWSGASDDGGIVHAAGGSRKATQAPLGFADLLAR